MCSDKQQRHSLWELYVLLCVSTQKNPLTFCLWMNVLLWSVTFYNLSYEPSGLGLKMFFFKDLKFSFTYLHRLLCFYIWLCLLVVCLFIFVSLRVCVCTTSSRCQLSSWPSSSSSCRSSRSSSSICSTFRGKGCSQSSLDRTACHCTPSLRVSI